MHNISGEQAYIQNDNSYLSEMALELKGGGTMPSDTKYVAYILPSKLPAPHRTCVDQPPTTLHFFTPFNRRLYSCFKC